MPGQTKRVSHCQDCGNPDRPAICATQHLFETVDSGNWISLVRCPECGALWQSHPYEPYAAFLYFVPWHWDAPFWRKVHDLDAGGTLSLWQEATLLSVWDHLTPADKKAVDAHRRRACGYQHTPYFRRFATDAEWKRYVASARAYFEKTFGAAQAELHLKRELAIPDLEELA
jgi:hypothetical protein